MVDYEREIDGGSIPSVPRRKIAAVTEEGYHFTLLIKSCRLALSAGLR